MTGLEKMKSQILNEAELSAKKILDEAKQDAEKVMQTAKENAEAECGRISKKSEAELEAVKERAASSRDLQKRKAILQAKQEVIAKILDDVYEALLVLDDKSYFEFIRKRLNRAFAVFFGIRNGRSYFTDHVGSKYACRQSYCKASHN